MNKRIYILSLIYFLRVLLVTVSVSSCNKDSLAEGNKNDDGSISFISSVNKTKTLVEDISDMDSFKVYGYYTSDGNTSNTVFDAVEVSKSVIEEETSWTYSPAKYWIPDAKYSFMGFYPVDATTTINSTSLDSDGQLSNPSFNYTLDSDFANQPDFMFAYKVVSEPETVELVFKHLLCQVSISIMTESTSQKIIVDNATLSGMSTTGRYTGFSSASDGEWSSFSGYSSYNESLGGVEVSDESNTISTYLLIPRSYESGALKLSLDCRESTDEGETYTSVNIVKAFPATEWEPSKKYNYIAEITIDYNILFSEPTITPWSSEQAAGSIIIK